MAGVPDNEDDLVLPFVGGLENSKIPASYPDFSTGLSAGTR